MGRQPARRPDWRTRFVTEIPAAVALFDRELRYLAASAAWWGRLDSHGRGEVLGALAEGWLQLGDLARARPYLDRMMSELPDTPYARNAAVRRADSAAKVPLTCLGCH